MNMRSKLERLEKEFAAALDPFDLKIYVTAGEEEARYFVVREGVETRITESEHSRLANLVKKQAGDTKIVVTVEGKEML